MEMQKAGGAVSEEGPIGKKPEHFPIFMIGISVVQVNEWNLMQTQMYIFNASLSLFLR